MAFLDWTVIPPADMILAGFLAQLSFSAIIMIATGYVGLDFIIWSQVPYKNIFPYPLWMMTEFCQKNGIPWLLLFMISAGVAIVTMLKSDYKDQKAAVVGGIAFAASFLLNFGGDNLGLMTIFCSRYNQSAPKVEYYDGYQDRLNISISRLNDVRSVYSYFSLFIMIMASMGIVANYLFLKKVTPQATKIPDPEIILLSARSLCTVSPLADHILV